MRVSKLCLLAISCLPASAWAQDCSILEYGARAGATEPATRAIQAAIDACAKRGGGRVVVPAGRFVTGTLFLRSGIELHVGAGAQLVGSPRLEDYPVLKRGRADDHVSPTGNPTAEDSEGTRALIVARDVTNVALTGIGIIDGNGPQFWGVGFMESGQARPALPRPRPWIWFVDTRQVTIRDIRLVDSPSYFLTFETSDDVFVEGVRIQGHPRSPNSDGIQVEGGRSIRIVGVDIRTGDDAIVLKSSAGPIEDVLITASRLESDDAAFKFGTGTEHPIRRVRISDSVIVNSRFGITAFMKDGGEISDFTASGLDIATGSRHATDYAVYVDVDRRLPNSRLGSIRNFALRDIRIRTRGNLLIGGHPRAPIRDLTLYDVHVTIEQPVDLSRLRGKPRGNALLSPLPDSVDYSQVNAHVTLAHVHGARIEGLRVGGTEADLAARTALHLAELRDVDLVGFRRDPIGEARTAIVTSEVADVRIRDARAEGPGALLRLDPGGEREVHVLDSEARGGRLLEQPLPGARIRPLPR